MLLDRVMEDEMSPYFVGDVRKILSDFPTICTLPSYEHMTMTNLHNNTININNTDRYFNPLEPREDFFS